MYLEGIWKEASDVSALHTPATRAQRAELALRWLEADEKWRGLFECWDVISNHPGAPPPPPQ